MRFGGRPGKGITLRRPRAPAAGESVVALIDVTFFLLVFFMLVGRLDASAPFTVRPPVGTTGTDLPAGGSTLSVAPDGSLALDGAPVAKDGLAPALRDVLARHPDALIRINADGAVEMTVILPLITQMEALGARDVAIIVTPTPP